MISCSNAVETLVAVRPQFDNLKGTNVNFYCIISYISSSNHNCLILDV